MTPATATRASDEDVVRMLELTRGVDSVELKLTVPDAHHRSTIVALGMDPLDAQIRTVSFFDTPDLTLNKAGVIVRARRVQGREDDSVIKLRPVEPDELPQRLRDNPDMGVELDAMPGGFVVSASMKARLGTNDVRRCVMGDRPIRKLFTKAQRAFYAEHAPEGIELDDLTLLGPIFVLKLRWTPPELRQKMVAEAWFYPNGSRILELSTKCPPSEMFQAAAEARGYLADNGVDLSGQQQAKTKTALDYFVKQHRAG
ncbi:MAG TPA: hypothetical protein VFX51_16240 [Solirubrobacteraceae bacterium]|nr:hypothetical protein [Solirubrobacteraceae bacterium]